MLEKKCLGTISEENLFDNTIAAYLLNPIKNEYPYEDIAKDYAGLMIPSRKDLIEKLTYEKAVEKKPEEFLKCVCYMAYVAYKTREPLETELADTGMEALFREIEMPLVSRWQIWKKKESLRPGGTKGVRRQACCAH